MPMKSSSGGTLNAIRLNVRELDPSPYKYSENGSINEIVDIYTNKGAVVVLEPHTKTRGAISHRLPAR